MADEINLHAKRDEFKRAAAWCREGAADGGAGGWTLLELLVVAAVLAVLLALAASLSPALLRATAERSALGELAGALNLARSEAVSARAIACFALAPTNPPLDGRSFRSYAVFRQSGLHGSETGQVMKWRDLPAGVYFDFPANPPLPEAQLPYPHPDSPTRALPVIAFLPDGSLDDLLHAAGAKPALTPRRGTREGDNPPEFSGPPAAGRVVVSRLTGKVEVEREE